MAWIKGGDAVLIICVSPVNIDFPGSRYVWCTCCLYMVCPQFGGAYRGARARSEAEAVHSLASGHVPLCGRVACQHVSGILHIRPGISARVLSGAHVFLTLPCLCPGALDPPPLYHRGPTGSMPLAWAAHCSPSSVLSRAHGDIS